MRRAVRVRSGLRALRDAASRHRASPAFIRSGLERAKVRSFPAKDVEKCRIPIGSMVKIHAMSQSILSPPGSSCRPAPRSIPLRTEGRADAAVSGGRAGPFPHRNR